MVKKRYGVLLFIRRAPWRAIIVGLACGIPIGIIVEAYAVANESGPPFAWDLSIGVLLGGIVGWVIPEFVNEMRARWSISKPLRALIQPFASNELRLTLFLAPLFPQDLRQFTKTSAAGQVLTTTVVPQHGMPWVVTEGDALALGYLMALLAKAGRSENILIVRDDSTIDTADCNIVCIGSPKSNNQAHHINGSYKRLPLKFAWDGDINILQTRDESEIWIGDEEHDYGAIIKAENEYYPGTSILILAGLSHVGTVGVAYHLWRNWRTLAAQVAGESFGAVLRVPRAHYQYTELVWTSIG